jgi:hypothetical protein
MGLSSRMGGRGGAVGEGGEDAGGCGRGRRGEGRGRRGSGSADAEPRQTKRKPRNVKNPGRRGGALNFRSLAGLPPKHPPYNKFLGKCKVLGFFGLGCVYCANYG